MAAMLPLPSGRAFPALQAHHKERSSADAPPGRNLGERRVGGVHPRLLQVRRKNGAGSSFPQLLGLHLTPSLGVGAQETSPQRWVELETGPQFLAQASAQLALNKDVFTRIWEQASVPLLAPQNDDSTAVG